MGRAALRGSRRVSGIVEELQRELRIWHRRQPRSGPPGRASQDQPVVYGKRPVQVFSELYIRARIQASADRLVPAAVREPEAELGRYRISVFVLILYGRPSVADP